MVTNYKQIWAKIRRKKEGEELNYWSKQVFFCLSFPLLSGENRENYGAELGEKTILWMDGFTPLGPFRNYRFHSNAVHRQMHNVHSHRTIIEGTFSRGVFVISLVFGFFIDFINAWGFRDCRLPRVPHAICFLSGSGPKEDRIDLRQNPTRLKSNNFGCFYLIK